MQEETRYWTSILKDKLTMTRSENEKWTLIVLQMATIKLRSVCEWDLNIEYTVELRYVFAARSILMQSLEQKTTSVVYWERQVNTASTSLIEESSQVINANRESIKSGLITAWWIDFSNCSPRPNCFTGDAYCLTIQQSNRTAYTVISVWSCEMYSFRMSRIPKWHNRSISW